MLNVVCEFFLVMLFLFAHVEKQCRTQNTTALKQQVFGIPSF